MPIICKYLLHPHNIPGKGCGCCHYIVAPGRAPVIAGILDMGCMWDKDEIIESHVFG